MSDSEIRRAIEARMRRLEAQIAALEAERDALRIRVNQLEALGCANPCCQLHQLD